MAICRISDQASLVLASLLFKLLPQMSLQIKIMITNGWIGIRSLLHRQTELMCYTKQIIIILHLILFNHYFMVPLYTPTPTPTPHFNPLTWDVNLRCFGLLLTNNCNFPLVANCCLNASDWRLICLSLKKKINQLMSFPFDKVYGHYLIVVEKHRLLPY